MHPQLDVAKLVGAASAPVALVIATCIFLGNLGAKHAMYMTIFRDLGAEYRKKKQHDTVRCRSIEQQIQLYGARMRTLMRATFWLTVSLLSFLTTVLFTSVGTVFPTVRLWTWLTGAFGLLGMIFLAVSVVMEMIENHHARLGLALEAAEFSGVDTSEQDRKELGQIFADTHEMDGETSPRS